MKKLSRRRVLGRSLGAAVAPLVVPAWLLGRAGGALPPPSRKINLGLVGLGSMGLRHVNGFLQEGDCRLAALCDVDAARLREAGEVVTRQQGADTFRAYHDFRDLLAQADLDAVCLSVPDHWHAIVAIASARAGLAIYGEKPLGLTIGDQQAMIREVRRSGVVWQTGSWQRSTWQFQQACQIVRNGRIGRLQRVEVGIGGGSSVPPQPVMPVPAGFDYDLWLGPAPWAPYTEKRCHWNFRWIHDYAGGQVTDWGAHHVDVAQWGMGADETGPVEIVGRGDFPGEGLWDAATAFRFACTYADGVVMEVFDDRDAHVKFIGSEGWVRVTRSELKANPPTLLRERFGANEVRLALGPRGENRQGHRRDFLNAVTSGDGRTICPIGPAHRSASVCHLGNIAMLLGRKIRWDPQAERVIGDESAQRMLHRPLRSPWTL